MPFPAIYPSTRVMKVEDSTAPQGRGQRAGPAVASTGCHGMPFGGSRRGHDGDDDGGQCSWKDTLLGRGRSSHDKGVA